MTNQILINGHSTRLNSWKNYLINFKPVNDFLVKTGKLAQWKLEREEKRLKKSLTRKY